MSYEMLTSPVELTDDQLDMVAGGQQQKQDGVVNVAAQDINVNVGVVALSRGTALDFKND